MRTQELGGGRLAPVWPVHPTDLTGGGCQTLSPVFFVFSTHICVQILLVHLYQHLSVPTFEINSWGHWLISVRHRPNQCPSPVWPVAHRTDPIVSTCRFQFQFYSNLIPESYTILLYSLWLRTVAMPKMKQSGSKKTRSTPRELSHDHETGGGGSAGGMHLRERAPKRRNE
jgi:hypothetical protein